MKWVEINIHLQDYNETDKFLLGFLRPFVEEVRAEGLYEAWHFFREPEVRLRFSGSPERIEALKKRLVKRLEEFSTRNPGTISKYFFGSHGVEGKEYEGEEERYGERLWPVAVKYFQDGAETALMILERGLEEPRAPYPNAPKAYGGVKEYLAARYIHLFCSQLGIDIGSECQIYLQLCRDYTAKADCLKGRF